MELALLSDLMGLDPWSGQRKFLRYPRPSCQGESKASQAILCFLPLELKVSGCQGEWA